MGFFNKVFGGADGVREAMNDAYSRHLRLAHEGKLPSDDSPHRTALYGALGSRYRTASKSFSELDLWTELAPFLAMPEGSAVTALAEYVVLMELPNQARFGSLCAAINQALQSTGDKELLRLAAVAFGRRVRWASLLSPNCARRMLAATEEVNVDDQLT